MELFWQNGPVVVQSQNQRPLRKPPPARHADDGIPSGPSTAREIENRHSQQVENIHNQHVFMQEDEMASWLHNPIVDDSHLDHNFCADLCYSPPTINNNSNQINNSSMHTNVRTSQVTELRQPSRSVAPRPPMLPAKRPETIHDSVHFSKLNARVEPGPSSSRNAARESTVVDSCDTPAAASAAAAAAAASGVSETVRSSAEPTEGDACRGSMGTTSVAAPSTTTAGGWTGGREAMTCEMTETSSPGGSSGSAEPDHKSPVEDRKRKSREADDSECHSEVSEYSLTLFFFPVTLALKNSLCNGLAYRARSW